MLIIARESFSTYGENKCMIFKGAIAVLPDDQADTLIMEGKAYKYDEGRGPDTDYVPGGDVKKPYCEPNTYMLVDNWGNDYWNADPEDPPITISIDVPLTLQLCTTDDAIDEYSVVSTNPSVITVTDNGISEGHRWVTITPIAEGEAIIEFDIPGNDCLVAFCYAVDGI